jgi:hypothetical protein
VLGRFIDPDIRPTSNLDSDFYRYDIRSGSWELISADTKMEGGVRRGLFFKLASIDV